TMKIVGKDSIVVVMKPSEASLSQILQPEPVDGWRKYNRYLRKETQQTENLDSLKGAVTLTFTIGEEGTPIDIKVIDSSRPALSTKAVELIREGPKWKPG